MDKLKKIGEEWVSCLSFLIKPSVVVAIFFLIIFFYLSFGTRFENEKIIQSLKDIIFPFLLLILGLWISKDWDKYNHKNIFRNQGALAISHLSRTKQKISDRLKINKLKQDLRFFLNDILRDIDGAIEAWETVNPEKNLEDKIEEIRAKEDENLKVSKEKIRKEEDEN